MLLNFHGWLKINVGNDWKFCLDPLNYSGHPEVIFKAVPHPTTYELPLAGRNDVIRHVMFLTFWPRSAVGSRTWLVIRCLERGDAEWVNEWATGWVSEWMNELVIDRVSEWVSERASDVRTYRIWSSPDLEILTAPGNCQSEFLRVCWVDFNCKSFQC